MNNLNTYEHTGCWHFSTFYFNREDPRIVVRKKSRIGWTLNLARPMAIPVFLLEIALILAPFKILEHYNIEPGEIHIITFIVILIAWLSWNSWMANPSRHQKTAPEHGAYPDNAR